MKHLLLFAFFIAVGYYACFYNHKAEIDHSCPRPTPPPKIVSRKPQEKGLKGSELRFAPHAPLRPLGSATIKNDIEL